MFQVTGDREEMYSNLEKDLIAQVVKKIVHMKMCKHVYHTVLYEEQRSCGVAWVIFFSVCILTFAESAHAQLCIYTGTVSAALCSCYS
jgi:hypothetical protein